MQSPAVAPRLRSVRLRYLGLKSEADTYRGSATVKNHPSSSARLLSKVSAVGASLGPTQRVACFAGYSGPSIAYGSLSINFLVVRKALSYFEMQYKNLLLRTNSWLSLIAGVPLKAESSPAITFWLVKLNFFSFADQTNVPAFRLTDTT